MNFTACQLQQIEAALKRSSFTPVCKPDGSFKEIQCATTPTLKCWEVNREGKKIQDIDVTIHLSAHRRQPQESKEKRIGVYPALEEDEIGNILALIKIIYYYFLDAWFKFLSWAKCRWGRKESQTNGRTVDEFLAIIKL